MKINCIILTYNRLEALKQCIRSIEASDCNPVNIFVVDNANDPAVNTWVSSRTCLGSPCTYISGNNDLGVIARNYAIDLVPEGEIVFQVDDDATVNKNCGTIIREWFSKPEVGAIGQDAWYFDGWLNFKGGVPVNTECQFLTGYLWAWRARKSRRYDEALAPFWREESSQQLLILSEGDKIFRCENLGSHASHRSGPVDWELHNRNHEYVINKWKGKVLTDEKR